MGRSKSVSCFKILPCGDGSGEEDAAVVPERRRSGNKRWLGFRKRSVKHRVLNITKVSETETSLSKDLTEAAAETNSNITDVEKGSEEVTWSSEKSILGKTSAPVTWVDEKPIAEKASSVTWADEAAVTDKVSTVTWADEKPSLISKETDGEFDTVDVTTTSINLDESIVIVIQAAVRSFLAREKLMKHKTVVKLQATVRGYLVRKHAVGTLRCVQAIVKMQTLVRAKQARLSLEKGDEREKGNIPNVTHVSIEKLLANRFARQILESTPKTKGINIKCDPSRSDSAWKWLERWMMVTSIERENQTQKPESSVKQDEDIELSTMQGENKYIFEGCKPTESEDIELSTMQGENKSIFEGCKSTESEDMQKQVEDAVEGLKPPMVTSDPEKNSLVCAEPTFAFANDNMIPDNENSMNLFPTKKSDLVAHMEELPIFGISEMQSETPNNNNISGQPLVLFPMVESNSAQDEETLCLENSNQVSVSKVEPTADFKPELHDEESSFSQNSTSEQLQLKELDLMAGFGSREESNPKPVDSQTKFEKLNSEGNLAKSTYEDITEPEPDSLSSSIVKETDPNNSNSTVDLAGNADCEAELPSLSMIHSPGRHKDELVNDVGQEVKNETDSGGINSTSPNAELDQLPVKAVTVVDLLEDKPVEQTAKTVTKATKPLSPEVTSPRSHFTTTESQGTPSTQISVNSKKAKTDKSASSSQKQRSLSAGRRSPSKYKPASSLDQLPKTTKLHRSPDKTDSGDSSSLPSYMQLTESMRAKANKSPRSSPDAQDRDLFIKKRHSLPVGNTRQGSPRVLQFTSRAHGPKRNDQSHERRWHV